LSLSFIWVAFSARKHRHLLLAYNRMPAKNPLSCRSDYQEWWDDPTPNPLMTRNGAVEAHQRLAALSRLGKSYAHQPHRHGAEHPFMSPPLAP
jgi:hypothetical protein